MNNLNSKKIEMQNYINELKSIVKSKDLNAYLKFVDAPREDSILRDDYIMKFDIMVKDYEGYFKDSDGVDDANKYLSYTIQEVFKIATKWNLDKSKVTEILLNNNINH